MIVILEGQFKFIWGNSSLYNENWIIIKRCILDLKVTGKENKTVIDGCNIKSYVDLM